MADVRRLAFDVLYRVLYEDAYSAIALNNAVKSNTLSKVDVGFLSALVYGVLERKLTLEHIIRQYSSVRIKKIEKKTLTVLSIGVYQLVFMDKVPDSAAVNESVKLCKALKLYKSASFVNAILRSLVRADKAYTLPDEKNEALYLSVKYSVPEDIVKMWLEKYGRELCEKMLAGLLGRPPITIRVNTLKTSKQELISLLEEQGIEVSESAFPDNALNIRSSGAVDSIKGFSEGLFYVEDASSQLCAEVLGAKPGETVCDVCAAPGGKSFYCAIRMENRGKVYSYDIHRHKLSLINEGADRLGISVITAAQRDAASEHEPLPRCGRILCDVPCSGLGILRRKPEIRYKTDTNIDILPKLQYSILCASAKSATNGCTIVYSTCTLNDAENIGTVSRFLEEHSDFVPVPFDPPAGVSRAQGDPPHCLTVLPGLYGTDGFFICKLRKV